jgi:NAD(P)-dependent dehydrogenase (short-subunit alcohol dehydrogenase family)
MTDQMNEASIEMVRALTAAQRIGRVEELASTLIWLVSDASSYVSGVTVPVDGGFVMP